MQSVLKNIFNRGAFDLHDYKIVSFNDVHIEFQSDSSFFSNLLICVLQRE